MIGWAALGIRAVFAAFIVWYCANQISQYGFYFGWLVKAVCGVFLCMGTPVLTVLKNLRGKELFELNSLPRKLAFTSLWLFALAGFLLL